MQDPRVSRRQLMRLAVMGAAGLVVSTRALLASGAPVAGAARRDPDAILRDLLDGNQRFSSGQAAGPRRKPEEFATLADGQTPEAVIVGCADSRVSPEILFDQGVGDLFVIRVAGNVVSNAGVIVKGSIEYAVAELGVPLILVLGHTQCGAVKAALQHLDAKDVLPGALAGLVDAVKPAVAAAKGKPGDPLDNTIRANVLAGVARLKVLPPIVGPAVKRGKVSVVGGVYDLKSGAVTMVG